MIAIFILSYCDLSANLISSLGLWFVWFGRRLWYWSLLKRFKQTCWSWLLEQYVTCKLFYQFYLWTMLMPIASAILTGSIYSIRGTKLTWTLNYLGKQLKSTFLRPPEIENLASLEFHNLRSRTREMRLSLKEVDHEIMTLTVAAFLKVKKCFWSIRKVVNRTFSFGTTLNSIIGVKISQQKQKVSSPHSITSSFPFQA